MNRLVLQPKYLEYKGDEKETPPVNTVVKMTLKGHKIINHAVTKDGEKFNNEVKYPIYESEQKSASYHVLQYELPVGVEVDISEFEVKGLSKCVAVWTEFDDHPHGMIVRPGDKIAMFAQPVWINTKLCEWSRVYITFYFNEKPELLSLSLVQRAPSEKQPDSYALDNKNELPTSFTIEDGYIIFNKVDSRKIEYDRLEQPVNKLTKL